MRIFGFAVLAGLGYASVFLVMIGALQFHIISALPDDAHLHAFRLFYFGGGLIACILGTGIGVMNFFTAGAASRILLLLPLLLPLLYSIVVLTAFSL